MEEILAESQAVQSESERIKDELDRKVFHLQMLLDTSRELAGLVRPAEIMESFLLMVMGPLGIIQGVCALVNRATCQGHVTGRGIGEPTLRELNRNIPEICDKYFAGTERTFPPIPKVRIINPENFADGGFCTGEMQIVILFDISAEYSGFLGLGKRITGENFGSDTINILLNLANILIGALSNSLSMLNTQQLNSDLLKKNADLEASGLLAAAAREELDKRIFCLKTLSDLNDELRNTVDVSELLRIFLMMANGSLGISRGFAFAYDRESRSGTAVSRGMGKERELDPETYEKLLYMSFGALENKTLKTMSSGTISNPGVFREAGIDLDAECAFFFVIHQSFMGAVVFGPALSGVPLAGNDLEFLSTLVAGLMAYLENAKAFEKICSLNQDLTHRNEELRLTIARLTEAKQKITLLEKARAHLKDVLQKEAEKVHGLRSLDLVLIVLLAAVIGVLFNFASPQGIPLAPPSVIQSSFDSVSVEQARRLVDEKQAVIVDARPKELYSQKHIKGAVHVPLNLFDIIYMMKLSRVDPAIPIIVYGANISRLYDVEVAQRLKKRDHEYVRVLSGGLESWEAQGYGVER